MLISIITVCYNAKDVIEKTIRSVVSQTFVDTEYIVVDGNSNDGTLELVKKYQADVDRLISEPDQGIYDAMNKGIKAANGDYVIFMNAGDYFCDEKTLSAFFDEINGRKADVYYGDVIYKYPYGERYMKALPLEKIKGMMAFSHQSVMVSAKIMKEIGFNISYRYAADYDCLLKCYLTKKSFLYIPIPVSIVEMDKGATALNFCTSKKEVLCIHKSCGYSFIERYRYFTLMMVKYYVHSMIKNILPSSLIRAIQKN